MNKLKELNRNDYEYRKKMTQENVKSTNARNKRQKKYS